MTVSNNGRLQLNNRSGDTTTKLDWWHNDDDNMTYDDDDDELTLVILATLLAGVVSVSRLARFESRFLVLFYKQKHDHVNLVEYWN